MAEPTPADLAEALALARQYAQVRDPDQRAALVAQIDALVGQEAEDGSPAWPPDVIAVAYGSRP